ncbi:unnamed protein product [Soboliphyme baturini]|uniref:Secreted protein n=1 Tax=Soboliphyme baturini TaxID=241478 RepID=A0A183IJX9_9BILA|nr:unnamed protein product [Soboliphyme baturini]
MHMYYWWFLAIMVMLRSRCHGYVAWDRFDGKVQCKGCTSNDWRNEFHPRRTEQEWPDMENIFYQVRASDGRRLLEKKQSSDQHTWKKFSTALQQQLGCMNDMNSVNCIARGFGK